jgi:hypothetical protein
MMVDIECMDKNIVSNIEGKNILDAKRAEEKGFSIVIKNMTTLIQHRVLVALKEYTHTALMAYMESTYNRVDEATFSSNNKALRNTCQEQNENVADYIVRVEVAARLVERSKADAKVSLAEKAQIIMDGLDKRFLGIITVWNFIPRKEVLQEDYDQLVTQLRLADRDKPLETPGGNLAMLVKPQCEKHKKKCYKCKQEGHIRRDCPGLKGGQRWVVRMQQEQS